MKPVVIVGAGLAGLTCARTLKRNRTPFLLLEAEDRIGGRLKTDEVGNYRLDRGYQVYFTAYPTAAVQLDEDKLLLKEFERGAIIIWDGEQYKVDRDNPLQFAISGFLSMGDKLRLGRWTSDVQWLDPEDIAEIPDRTSEQYLRDEGFSEDFIERFARPFFGGIFLDRSLSTSCRLLVFIWKALSEGQTTIPELGMEAIPKQIGMTFGPEVLHLNTRVLELVKQDGEVRGVKLDTGQIIEADKVVLACDASQAAQLSGVPIDVEFRHSITIYFTAPEHPVEGGWIVLNGNMRGITNHVVPVSNVVPLGERATDHLISATILGERTETDDQLAEIVKSEMRIWFPDHDAETWKFLRAYRIQNAQMAQPPGFRKNLPNNDSGIQRLYFAGEFTEHSSIEGAIRSGVECAGLILSRTEAGVA